MNLKTSAVIVEALTGLATNVTAPIIFTMTSLNHVTDGGHVTAPATHGPAPTVSVAGGITASSLRPQTAVVAVGSAVIGRFPAVNPNFEHDFQKRKIHL